MFNSVRTYALHEFHFVIFVFYWMSFLLVAFTYFCGLVLLLIRSLGLAILLFLLPFTILN